MAVEYGDSKANILAGLDKGVYKGTDLATIDRLNGSINSTLVRYEVIRSPYRYRYRRRLVEVKSP